MSDSDFEPSGNAEWGIATKGVRAGTHRTEEGEHSSAIYMTSSFVFDSAEACAARFAGDELDATLSYDAPASASR